MAGGAYIVQQAGGIVTDFSEQENYVFGNSIVAANPDIHQALIQRIDTKKF